MNLIAVTAYALYALTAPMDLPTKSPVANNLASHELRTDNVGSPSALNKISPELVKSLHEAPTLPAQFSPISGSENLLAQTIQRYGLSNDEKTRAVLQWLQLCRQGIRTPPPSFLSPSMPCPPQNPAVRRRWDLPVPPEYYDNLYRATPQELCLSSPNAQQCLRNYYHHRY